VKDFNNWRFFQHDNLDIKPGDWQMPCGTDVERTKVYITRADNIPNCHGPIYGERVACFEIDKNCNLYCVVCPP